MIKLTINNQQHTLDVDPEMPLLWAIRDTLKLTGTKFGCGMAQCGACTVHVNGAATRSCVTPVKAVEGQKITTIEGVTQDKNKTRAAEAVQLAWNQLDVVQCGYCQSGQIMQAIDLLSINPAPDDMAIEQAMSGNLCRCNTYVRIRKAIKLAAKSLA